MPQQQDYVRQSIDLHLFFARIMKEHSFFLATSFTSRDVAYKQQAELFNREYDKLLWEVISIADGNVSQDVIQSGEVFSQFTIKAEVASSYYTGIFIPSELTQAELNLQHGNKYSNQNLESKVYDINQRVIELTGSLINFKSKILSNVLSCKMFTQNYPLLLDHITREAKLYLMMTQRLQNSEIYIENEIIEQEIFWNRIMAEHSKFIRGLLDPTEDKLFNTANNFGNEFDQLTSDAKAAMDNTIPVSTVTDESLEATKNLRDFKAQGTQGILECKVKSIILPLLADHTLREANHFLRLLKSFSS